MDSTVKEDRFQRGEKAHARSSSLGGVGGDNSKWVDAKALQEDLQSLGFTSSLDKSEMGKEVRKRRARS